MSATHSVNAVSPALRALLRGLIDYAGLFPPAALSMEQAVANFARYVRSDQAWMLGRFVLAAGKLEQFTAERAKHAAGEWRLTVLSEATPGDVEAITLFNQEHKGAAVIDSVEFKASDAGGLGRALAVFPDLLSRFCELAPNTPELRPMLQALAQAGARAKVRTGGLTAEAFPASTMVAEFLAACSRTGVAFKATAGLHHPMRCVKPFTYEADSAKGTMHGFLNVFLAAAFTRVGKGAAFAQQVIECEDAREFIFNQDGASWRGERLSTEQLRDTRANFAISFGSCSFEEPIQDLAELHLL